MKNLGFSKEDLRYLSKEELKAKLGNMKISKAELNAKWEQYELQRKDNIQKILEVGDIDPKQCLIVALGKEEYSI